MTTAVDDLYLERLETLYEKQLSDTRAFAQREGRPFDEVRTKLAEWHSKDLFTPRGDGSKQRKAVKEQVLRSLSQALESLLAVAGLQSFFLVVDPADSADEGFLGGTLLGREFWRGHRGCGAPGARAFQTHCQRLATGASEAAASGASVGQVRGLGAQAVSASISASGSRVQALPPDAEYSTPSPAGPQIQSAHATTVRKGPAGTMKTEVYAGIRNAIRAASGIRNAEMKWTNHTKLSQYGIRLDGWPDGVPIQNPSNLSTAQNRAILEGLATGTLKFVPLAGDSAVAEGSSPAHDQPTLEDDEREEDVFAGTINFSWDEYTTGDREETDLAAPGDPDQGREGTPAAIIEETQFHDVESTTDVGGSNLGTHELHEGEIGRKRKRDEP